MPFKSEAQRQRAKRQLAAGEISQETYDAWDKDTPAEIPERIHRPKHPVDAPAAADEGAPAQPEAWKPEEW